MNVVYSTTPRPPSHSPAPAVPTLMNCNISVVRAGRWQFRWDFNWILKIYMLLLRRSAPVPRPERQTHQTPANLRLMARVYTLNIPYRTGTNGRICGQMRHSDEERQSVRLLRLDRVRAGKCERARSLVRFRLRYFGFGLPLGDAGALVHPVGFFACANAGGYECVTTIWHMETGQLILLVMEVCVRDTLITIITGSVKLLFQLTRNWFVASFVGIWMSSAFTGMKH